MPVRFLCLDEGSDFVHDLVEQINRHSEVDGEGLPVGIKAGDVGLSSPLLLCEPRHGRTHQRLDFLDLRLEDWPFCCCCCWSRAAAVSLLSISTSMKSRIKMSPSSGVVSIGMLTV